MVKNQLYEEMFEEYKKGYSLEQVGKMFGMTRQSVYSGFKIRSFEMRKKKEIPFQMFNGEKFTQHNKGYLKSTTNNRRLMHRVVWEHFKEKIPKGYDIHHINHNKQDNRIENLELYSKSEHARKFATGKNQHTK